MGRGCIGRMMPCRDIRSLGVMEETLDTTMLCIEARSQSPIPSISPYSTSFKVAAHPAALTFGVVVPKPL